MNDITQPLRLAVGSHQRGSGKGCAMNLISWENGDAIITDLPDCADPVLANIVQRVNDTYCTHRDGDLLCAPCSLAVLDLAHRTVGTGTLPLTDLERRVVWVRIAADQARAVLHLAGSGRDAAVRAIEAAEGWADSPTAAAAANAAAYAANVAAAYAAAYAAAAYAAAAVNAAAAAYAAYAAYAAAAAANVAAAANAAAYALAVRAFDLFDQLTAHSRVSVADGDVTRAYACMTA